LDDGRRENRKGAGAQGTEEKGAIFFKPDQRFCETLQEVNAAGRRVVEAAVEVHRHLGPGYVESVYENATDVHVAQAFSYLKATGHPLALLINFNVPVLLRGVKCIVRNHRSIHAQQTTAAPESEGEQK